MEKTNYFRHPQYLLLRLAERRLFWLSDKAYLKMRYKEVFGKKLDLEDPKTFNEKLQWMKLYDRNPKYIKMVDKCDAKDYVRKKIGEKYVIPTIGVYNNVEEINFGKLPNQFALKCTHNSGEGMLICNNKTKIDWPLEKKRIKKALGRNFYCMSREWPYKEIKPRVIIEKYMGDDLVDYRFYCFGGKVEYIYQYISRSQKDQTKPEPEHCNIYNRDWELEDFHQASLPTKEKYEKPRELEEMVRLAEELAVEMPFVRVDFYIIDKAIYFGELTFFPGGGLSAFHPEKYDSIVGEKLKLKGGSE